MKKKSRVGQTVQNIVYSVIGQVVSLLLSFILRWIFVKTLFEDFLGLDSVFTNVVSMLSLAELGVGAAINYSLYEPLAKGNTKLVIDLMNFYKRIYRIIGSSILAIGLILLPFAHSIVGKTSFSTNSVRLYFFTYVVATAISYFYSYKRTLIIADQYRSIAIVYRYFFFSILTLFQIIFLLLFKNYFFYLLLKVAFTFLENYFISKKADNMYPYLSEKRGYYLSKEMRNEIWKNSIAMSFHKIGGIVVNSTDSVLISHFIGIGVAGIYSNYQLVTSAINIFVNQFFTSIVASVGNLAVESSKSKLNNVFNQIFLIGTWLSLFCSAMLYIMLNPFIEVWLGNDMLLSKRTLFLIVVNFYLIQDRRSGLTFRDALGLYWYDRYKPLVEAVLNLMLSLLFVQYIALDGILLGTTLSMILTSIWIEPYILYKKSLGKGLFTYLLKLSIWSTIGFVIFIVQSQIVSKVDIDYSFLNIILLFLISSVGYVLISVFLFIWSDDFKDVMRTIRSILLSRYRKSD